MKLPFESPQGDLGSGIFHAEANIEVRLGSVALSAFGADCGCPCARVPLFADYGRSTRDPLFTRSRNGGDGYAKRLRSRRECSRIDPPGPRRVCTRPDVNEWTRKSVGRQPSKSLT